MSVIEATTQCWKGYYYVRGKTKHSRFINKHHVVPTHARVSHNVPTLIIVVGGIRGVGEGVVTVMIMLYVL